MSPLGDTSIRPLALTVATVRKRALPDEGGNMGVDVIDHLVRGRAFRKIVDCAELLNRVISRYLSHGSPLPMSHDLARQ